MGNVIPQRPATTMVGAVFAATVLFTTAGPAEASRTRASTTSVTATPATHQLSYAALGDSYSSGNGAGGYDLAEAPCRRSSQGYAPRWAHQHRLRAFTFLACSGADTADVALRQARRLPRDTDLVTITIGGNDVGFSMALGTCTAVASNALCTAAIRAGKIAAVTTAPTGLAVDLAAVKHRAPHARVVVLGYPRLFERGPCAVAGAPSDRRRADLNHAVNLLNTSLAKVARASGARFIDVRERFAGHGVCAPPAKAWINPSTMGAEAYHPTATGHSKGYLAALTAAIG